MAALEYGVTIQFDQNKIEETIKRIEEKFSKLEIDINAPKVEKEGKKQEQKTAQDSLNEIKSLGDRFKALSKSIKDKVGGNLQTIVQGVAPILIAVTSIAGFIALMFESSQMLQNTFGIFTKSIMLIMRPIGDLFATLMRPFMIMFLTQVAIPFYTEAMPVIRQWGKWLAADEGPLEYIKKNWEDNAKFWEEAGKGLKDFLGIGNDEKNKGILPNAYADDGSQLDVWSDIGKGIEEWWASVTESLPTWEEVSKGFTDWWDGIWESANAVWEGFTSPIGAWWDKVWEEMPTWNMVMDGIGAWWDSVWSDMPTNLEGVMDDIGTWWGKIWDGMPATIDGIISKVVGWWDKVWADMELPTLGDLKDALFSWWDSIWSGSDNVDGDEEGEKTASWFDSFLSGIGDAPDAVTGFFSDVAGKVQKVIGDDPMGRINQFFMGAGLQIPGMQENWNSILASFAIIKNETMPELLDHWKNIATKTVSIASILQRAYERAKRILQQIRSAKSSGYATGGLISEHVIGVGQSSGRTYEIGERGPEYVVPAGQAHTGGGSTNVTINVTVNGGKGMDEAKLAKEIERQFGHLRRRGGIL